MAASFGNRHFENVCRLCLTDASEAGDMIPIFPVRGGNPNHPSSMVNRILQCTSLKLEPAEGVPAAICELCSVRLEDWQAFREQCLGTDEYLRVTLRHAFFPEEMRTVPSVPGSQVSPGHHDPNDLKRLAQLSRRNSVHSSSLVPASTSTSSGSRLILAKRRQSTVEWRISDPLGKGAGVRETTVEEAFDGFSEPGPSATPPVGSNEPHLSNLPDFQPGDHAVPLDDFLVKEHLEDGNPSSSGVSTDTVVLEQASWSKEYCARVNSLMVLGNGPRPFKCKICRRQFKTRANLRRHIKCSHGDEIVEAESPPPECYGYGHIDRIGAPRATERPPEEKSPETKSPPKRKRKSTEPLIPGSYPCEFCPRSFKMAAHLAVHRKTHRNLIRRQLETLELCEMEMTGTPPSVASSKPSAGSAKRKKINIEPTDIIQLSDDDDEDNITGRAINDDDPDDGFDEEEGSLKEAGSAEPSLPELRPDPTSFAIVELGADDDVQCVNVDEDVVMVPEKIVTKSAPSPSNIVPSSRPGPLSSKMRHITQQQQQQQQQPQPQPQQPKQQQPKQQQPQQQQQQQLQQQQQQQQQQHQSGKGQPMPMLSVRPKEQLMQQQPPAGPAVSKSRPTTSSSSVVSGTVSTLAQHRCHFCRQTFAREDLLREHQKTHQRETACPFRCGWCQKGFRYRQNFMLHLEKQTCRLMNADPVRGGQ